MESSVVDRLVMEASALSYEELLDLIGRLVQFARANGWMTDDGPSND